MLDHRLHPRDFYAQDVKRPFGVYGLGCCQYRNGAVVLLASLGSVATSFGRGRSPVRSVPLVLPWNRGHPFDTFLGMTVTIGSIDVGNNGPSTR